jgi:predicted nucleic acid-binding protein
MSRAYFLDTSAVLAALSPSDAHHQQVVRWLAVQPRRLVTTAWVLTEIADALSASRSRRLCARYLRALMQDPLMMIVPATQDLFERGLSLYEKRADKDWSLTDCVSFLVMQDLQLAEALTADHHFSQAGFVALFA